MSRFALIGCAGLLAAGCFYSDPLNQRPSLDIEQIDPAQLFRGGSVELRAISHDPDGHFVWFHWRGYACTSDGDCDAAPFFESSDAQPTIDIPDARLDPAQPFRFLHVVLEGTDDFGATAKPPQQLWLDITDRSPTVEIFTASSYGYVVDTGIKVIARIADPDKADVPQISWKVFTPTMPPDELVDTMVDQEAGYVTYAKLFTPHEVGEFEIQVIADDKLGVEASIATGSKKILVGDDMPPCLRQLTPLVATAPSAWPMSEPTLFQVHVVADDLDPYPTVNDPTLRPTEFSWSLLAPGSTRQLLTGVTGNSVALDPASYQPGDILELRVEIDDRKNRQLMCADGVATCSVSTDTTCLQRQTWRVEVR